MLINYVEFGDRMGKQFKQLTYDDRVVLTHLLKQGVRKSEIAKQLGKHRSSIYREIKRNSYSKGYLCLYADKKLKKRRLRKYKLFENEPLREYVLDKLKANWSPEQIAGRLRLENNGDTILCHETIYRYLYSDYGIRNKYYQFLRRKRLWRMPRVSRKQHLKIPNRIGIHERPKEINDRSEFGHWEGDLMVFSKGISGNLITLRERKSRFMVAIRNETKQAKKTASKIINALSVFNDKVKSLTFDNGNEFYDHQRIAEKLSLKTYFCDPYKSYQKGSVENGIGC